MSLYLLRDLGNHSIVHSRHDPHSPPQAAHRLTDFCRVADLSASVLRGGVLRSLSLSHTLDIAAAGGIRSRYLVYFGVYFGLPTSLAPSAPPAILRHVTTTNIATSRRRIIFPDRKSTRLNSS